MTTRDATTTVPSSPGVDGTSLSARAGRPIPDVDLDALVAAAHRNYRDRRPRSAAADERARRVLPGGNTRSVLDFRPFPFRVATASAAEIADIDGLTYVDLCGNFTAGLLGHTPSSVRDAVLASLAGGWAVGAARGREME